MDCRWLKEVIEQGTEEKWQMVELSEPRSRADSGQTCGGQHSYASGGQWTFEWNRQWIANDEVVWTAVSRLRIVVELRLMNETMDGLRQTTDNVLPPTASHVNVQNATHRTSVVLSGRRTLARPNIQINVILTILEYS